MSARITVGQKSTDMIKNMRKYITIPHSSRSRLPLSIGMGTAQEETDGTAFPFPGHRERHRGPEFRSPPRQGGGGGGAGLTRRDGGQEYDLGREGGHSKRRIFHAKDLTGREVERALLARARATPPLRIYEDYAAINPITP